MQSRIVPLLPYGLVNYAAGVTRLRFRDMAAGTAIGAAPKVLLAIGGALFVRRQIVAERGTAST